MMRFQNLYYDSFLKKYRNKKIIAYGIGGTFRDFLKTQTEKIELLQSIEFLLDGDLSKKGMPLQVGDRILTIQTLENYIGKDSMADKYVMILFLADRYIPGALKELDQISAFDKMICLYGLTTLQWGMEQFPPISQERQMLRQSEEMYKIPKVIHYCWFGPNKLPEENLKYMESWKKNCPDYTIMMWNENNYSLEDSPLYVRQAYEAEKYSFVSDYVRLDILYKYGGIYLDTDVELLGSLDRLLSYNAFFAFEHFNLINTGLGCGCIKGEKLMGELRALYENRPFLKEDNTYDMTACSFIHTDFFRNKGIEICNKTQVIHQILFLSSDFLCSFDQGRGVYALTENSIGIHHFDCSWFNEKERKKWKNFKEERAMVNQRLLQDFIWTLVD